MTVWNQFPTNSDESKLAHGLPDTPQPVVSSAGRGGPSNRRAGRRPSRVEGFATELIAGSQLLLCNYGRIEVALLQQDAPLTELIQLIERTLIFLCQSRCACALTVTILLQPLR